jgi:prepilin-type N-terminal cleavage/methylation domain-containing protein
MKHPRTQHGFSLIEMLVYIALLSTIFVVVVATLLSFTTGYRVLAAHRIVEHSAMSSLERLTRDLRGATSIDMGNSTFGTSPGILTLITNQNGNATTTKYYVQNNTLKLDVNGTYFGPLTTAKVTVSNLTYTLLTGSTTSAVKIDMTLTSTNGQAVQTRTYHTTVVLKAL